MHADAIGDAERREIFAREARVDRIEFNRVDAGALGAMGEPQRRIAERTTELEHALGCNGGGNHTEDGTVLERIGTATVLGAVSQGLRAHLGERVRRFLRGHACRPSPVGKDHTLEG